MPLFPKAKKENGWLAITSVPEGLCIAHTLRVNGDKPVVSRCGVEQGDISNLAAMGKIAREAHLGHYHCTTLLNGSEYQLLLVEAPAVPPQELKTAMRWRIKDMLDYHIDDATIDVLDIPPDKNAPARNHSMYAVAARNEVIEKRVTLFDQANIPLEVIDIPEMAQRNISALLEEEGRGLAMLSFNAEGGLLTVTYGGELYLARRIELSWPQLAVADVAQRQINFDRITLELQRSLDHFDRQFHFITISKLMLAPLPEPVDLRDYLAGNLYLPVMTLDLNDILDFSKTPMLQHAQQQAQFFLSLGASLRLEEKAL